MADRTTSGPRVGRPRPVPREVLTAVGVLPGRTSDVPEARALQQRDGAVVVREPGAGPAAVPVVAPLLYGGQRVADGPQPGTPAGPDVSAVRAPVDATVVLSSPEPVIAR